MPKKIRVPKLRHYTPKNLAVVRLDGRDRYLGKYGSPESVEQYHRLIAEWLEAKADGETVASPPAEAVCQLSVSEMLVRYWKFAKSYYQKDGKPTHELACMRDAIRPLRKLYGRSRATEFGPLKLKAIRQHMIDVQSLARTEVNKRIGRIKRVFKYAVSEELIPPSVFEGLRTVDGLRFGRTTARETEPVTPVAAADVEATLPYVSPQVAAMIQLQDLTGMRPNEVVQLRPADIDRSAEIWIFEPRDHKNRWRGHRRIVPLGPKAQAILIPYFDRSTESPCFSPKEAEEWRNEQRAKRRDPNRKTPVYPSELKAREKRKQQRKKRKRPLRECFDVSSYRRAITYGIKKAKKNGVVIAHWHPNQLRHSCATRIREAHGIEAAQVVLGHARADVTEVYAERNLELAKRIAGQVG